MAGGNTPAPQGSYTNVLGLVNDVDLAIVTEGVLDFVVDESIGVYATATADNPTVVSTGGTVIFTEVGFIKSNEYTKANKDDSPQNPGAGTVKSSIAGRRRLSMELETMDINLMEVKTAEQFQSALIRSFGLSMSMELDAEFAELAFETATANKATQEIVVAKAVDVTATEAEERVLWKQYAFAGADLARTIIADKGIVGVPRAKVISIIDERYKINIKAGMPKGGDSATGLGKDIVEALPGQTEVVGSIPTKTHIFMGQKFDADTLMAVDKSFDFTDLAGVMVHTQALHVASTTSGTNIVQTVGENSGNPKWIFKYGIYKKAIRPQLVRSFVTKASA